MTVITAPSPALSVMQSPNTETRLQFLDEQSYPTAFSEYEYVGVRAAAICIAS
jgi:hypothetical protein